MSRFDRNFKGRFEYVRAQLAVLKSPSQLKVLDIGNIGGGNSSHREIAGIVEQEQGMIVGCDRAVDLALKQQFSLQVVGDLSTLPFKSEIFNIVYLGEILEHVWNPAGALAEVRRVLMPESLVILDTPNPYAFGRILLWLVLGKDHIGDDDHKLFYTPAILENLLERSGFVVLDMQTDRKFSVGRFKVRWVPWSKRLGSHLLCTAQKR